MTHSCAAAANAQLAQARRRLEQHEQVRQVHHDPQNHVVNGPALNIFLAGDRIGPEICRIVWETDLEIRAFQTKAGGRWAELLLA